MYQIANVPHVDPREARADIPECLVKVIDRLLQKTPEARYQTGAEVSAELRRCVPAQAAEAAAS
jgi:serine/threonine-protein kinase